jgi:hypothetical protein
MFFFAGFAFAAALAFLAESISRLPRHSLARRRVARTYPVLDYYRKHVD